MTKSKNILHKLLKPFTSGSNREKQNEDDLEKLAAQEQQYFQYETLVSATKNFHPTHKLGEGGFGPVYKGMLSDGTEIAVKKLAQTSRQGKREFLNEAKLLAKVQHRNIINLLGYCAHDTEKLLVYEYVSNESLDKFLFKSNRREQLDWKLRFDIISGVTRGLVYLHEDSHTCIIHRDIKASNILLDDRWSPKIADFGMARLFPEDETHVNTRIAGTSGYMAPEYVMQGQLSVKADVFSFGVLVLELISGQRNSTFHQHDAQNLLEWAYKLFKKDQILEIMDPVLASSVVPEQLKTCIHVGLLCSQGDPKLRPDMRRVLILLSKKPGSLEEPTKPGLLAYRNRRSHRPPGMSSTAGSSGDSDARTSDSSAMTNTASASTSALASPRRDRHGKRPAQS